jgi:hypothetical protein
MFLLLALTGALIFLYGATAGHAELWRVAVPPLAAILLLEVLAAYLPHLHELMGEGAADGEAFLLLAYIFAVTIVTACVGTQQVALMVFCAGTLCAAASILWRELLARRATAISRRK